MLCVGRTFSLFVEEAQGRDLHVGHAADEVDEHHLGGRKRRRFIDGVIDLSQEEKTRYHTTF